MKKDTSELLKEPQGFSDFNDFFAENRESISAVSLSEYLNTLIAQKGLSRSEIVSRSEMSEVYAYQILSGTRANPKREKVICLAFGMKLTFEETQDLLRKTGYPPLYAKIPADCVIIYGLCKGMTVPEVNDLLYQYGEETLG